MQKYKFTGYFRFHISFLGAFNGTKTVDLLKAYRTHGALQVEQFQCLLPLPLHFKEMRPTAHTRIVRTDELLDLHADLFF